MRAALGWYWLLGCVLTAPVAASVTQAGIKWQRDDRAAFQQAREQDRFVLLYLEAVWCHWCHVMDEQTYADPQVQAILAKHYVTLRIDQDLRPDLANRYRDYGWPATIVFAADGSEIVKRRGYLPRERMIRLLNAIVADPSPEQLATVDDRPAPVKGTGLPAVVRSELLQRHQDSYDPRHGGLRGAMKSMDRDQVEYLLWQAAHGDLEAGVRARKSLDGALQLLDPAWGGVYQYSTGGDWSHPHFEKLTRLQGEYLRIFALACAQLEREADCAGARSLLRYLRSFQQTADGSFHTAQDADLRPGEHSAGYFALDDAARRALGIPAIDVHVYARENGLVIEALAAWFEASGEVAALEDARRAARRMLASRALPDGGFRHDAKDAAGPYLADTLAMGRGFLALYRADGDRRWLQHASTAAGFIQQNFQTDHGFLTAVRGDAPIAPLPHLDEVLGLTRFCNLLAHYTGKAQHRACAAHGLAWLARPDVALSRSTDAGILLADEEISAQPLHLTIRGDKQDPTAGALFAAAQRVPRWYKRLDWWDDAEGPLPNADIAYPKLKQAAAFFCTEQTCSLPLKTPAAVLEFWEQTGQPQAISPDPAAASSSAAAGLQLPSAGLNGPATRPAAAAW